MVMLLTVAVFAATAAAAPHTVYPEPALPSGWVSQFSEPMVAGRDAASVVHLVAKVTLAVREQNMDRIRKIAMDVSNPDSNIYGKYLSQAKVDEITAPAAADVTAVRSWLIAERFAGTVLGSRAVLYEEHDFRRYSSTRVPVGPANRL